MTTADNLTDDELNAFEWHGCSSGTSTPLMVRDAIVRATAEIRRHRTTRGAPDLRERTVALEAAIERMAPVVAAAERWVDDGPVNAGIKRAVEAYRAKIHGHIGTPGVRNPEHPCADYDSAPGTPALGDPRICEGDGHSLCKDCRHHIEPSALQQEETKTPP